MLNPPNYERLPKFTPPNLLNPYSEKHPSRPHIRRLSKNSTRYIFSKEAMSSLSRADQLLFERFGQGPVVDVPYHAIHHPFEEHAAANPEAVAAQHFDESITYGELNRQASRLAAVLTQHGVKNGDNVALFLQRSIPMLVGIIAALKIGAAYIPQHVGVAPEAQLRHILNATAAKVILTISSLQHMVPVPEGHICIAIDELMEEPFGEEAVEFTPQERVGRNNTCFILFTSGTTGKPNGVRVTHGNVCNILLTEPGGLGIRPGYKVSQILSIAFDMAAWEILGCLSHGATLVIRGKDIAAAVEEVDIIIATPSILGTIDPARCKNVKAAAVAGEPCPRPLADRWSAICDFYNSCGPTETTIINTAQLYRPWSERLTIGSPTPNNTVYVLDENMQPCAIGEVGEMWAGGDCVTAGYLDNDQLNAERYKPDPFLGDNRLMFRTRDLGRWTPEGELEHFGRTDDQVKIRGFRVELDSVSAVLESVPSCKRAVTMKLDNRNLVSFVSPQSVDVDSARQAVESKLPYYCVPALVIAMDEFPVTSRGKVDKRSLMRLAKERQEAEKARPELLEAVPC